MHCPDDPYRFQLLPISQLHHRQADGPPDPGRIQGTEAAAHALCVNMYLYMSLLTREPPLLRQSPCFAIDVLPPCLQSHTVDDVIALRCFFLPTAEAGVVDSMVVMELNDTEVADIQGDSRLPCRHES